MNRNSLSIVCVLALAAILNTSYLILHTPLVHAQGIPSSFGVDLTASAQNPIPGQQVTITARNYNADINSSKITWSVNGKVVQSGTGLTTLIVTAPAFGKSLNIKVSSVTTEGLSMTGSIVVGSGSVDMVVETDGYTPPAFPGKTPIAYQNSVTVIAVPHISNSSGTEYDPKTLIYQWSKSDQVMESQSGYGKQSVTIPGDIIPRPYEITVTVTPRTGSGQASSIITITPQSPFISFYLNDALYGPLYNSALGATFRIGSQREANVLAVPYGFSKPANGLGDLSLTWLINNVEHPELATNDSVILRAPQGTAGSSNVEIDINNTKNILQTAKASFTATFSAKASATSSINY